MLSTPGLYKWMRIAGAVGLLVSFAALAMGIYDVLGAPYLWSVSHGGTGNTTLPGNQIVITNPGGTALLGAGPMGNGTSIFGCDGEPPGPGTITGLGGVTVTPTCHGVELTINGSGGVVTSVSGTVDQIVPYTPPQVGDVVLAIAPVFRFPGNRADSTTANASAAGATQIAATPLTSTYTTVITCTSSAYGVALPAVSFPGMVVVVTNAPTTAFPLSVYPEFGSGAQIDEAGVGNPIVVAIGSALTVQAQSATQWFTVGPQMYTTGAGITATPTNGGWVWANTGVTQVIHGTGISVSPLGGTGPVTISNTGTLGVSPTPNEITVTPGSNPQIAISASLVLPGNVSVSTTTLTSVGTVGVTILTTTYTLINTNCASGHGVNLPVITSPYVGAIFTVSNGGTTNNCNVWPGAGAAIDGGSTGAAVTLDQGFTATWTALSTTQWVTSVPPYYGINGIVTGSSVGSNTVSLVIPVTVPHGGTGAITFPDYNVIAQGASTSGPLVGIAPMAQGTVLMSQGVSSPTVFGEILAGTGIGVNTSVAGQITLSVNAISPSITLSHVPQQTTVNTVGNDTTIGIALDLVIPGTISFQTGGLAGAATQGVAIINTTITFITCDPNTGVTLPVPSDAILGIAFFIQNQGTLPCFIWPNSGGYVDDFQQDVPEILNVDQTALYVGVEPPPGTFWLNLLENYTGVPYEIAITPDTTFNAGAAIGLPPQLVIPGTVSVSNANLAAGPNQGNVSVTATYTYLVSCAAGGVTLPDPTTATLGMVVMVQNLDGVPCLIWPAAGGQLDYLDVNVPEILLPDQAALYIAVLASPTSSWDNLLENFTGTPFEIVVTPDSAFFTGSTIGLSSTLVVPGTLSISTASVASGGGQGDVTLGTTYTFISSCEGGSVTLPAPTAQTVGLLVLVQNEDFVPCLVWPDVGGFLDNWATNVPEILQPDQAALYVALDPAPNSNWENVLENFTGVPNQIVVTPDATTFAGSFIGLPDEVVFPGFYYESTFEFVPSGAAQNSTFLDTTFAAVICELANNGVTLPPVTSVLQGLVMTITNVGNVPCFIYPRGGDSIYDLANNVAAILPMATTVRYQSLFAGGNGHWFPIFAPPFAGPGITVVTNAAGNYTISADSSSLVTSVNGFMNQIDVSPTVGNVVVTLDPVLVIPGTLSTSTATFQTSSTSQGGTPIPATFNIIGCTANAGVTLPLITSVQTGMIVTIWNNWGNILSRACNIWPHSGDEINLLAPNEPAILQRNSVVAYQASESSPAFWATVVAPPFAGAGIVVTNNPAGNWTISADSSALVTSVEGTGYQIDVTPTTGNAVVSLNNTLVFPGTYSESESFLVPSGVQGGAVITTTWTRVVCHNDTSGVTLPPAVAGTRGIVFTISNEGNTYPCLIWPSSGDVVGIASPTDRYAILPSFTTVRYQTAGTSPDAFWTPLYAPPNAGVGITTTVNVQGNITISADLEAGSGITLTPMGNAIQINATGIGTGIVVLTYPTMTWTIPTGTSMLYISLCGAGGGGGAGSASAGGGGGGAGLCIVDYPLFVGTQAPGSLVLMEIGLGGTSGLNGSQTILTALGSDAISIVAFGGGAGGPAVGVVGGGGGGSAGAGGPGGSGHFSGSPGSGGAGSGPEQIQYNLPVCLGAPGAVGGGAVGNNGVTCVPFVWSGGSGGGGGNMAGGMGGYINGFLLGGTAFGYGGGGGASMFGAGGNGDGNAGFAYGAGGAGGGLSASGGKGSDGVVQIRYS